MTAYETRGKRRNGAWPDESERGQNRICFSSEEISEIPGSYFESALAEEHLSAACCRAEETSRMCVITIDKIEQMR